MKKKKNKVEVLDDLNYKFDRGFDNKVNAEKNAIININYINGKQYLRYNSETQVLEEINNEQEKDYREKEVFNRIRALRNTILTKIKDKYPIPIAIPMTADDSDADAAKATTQVLNDLLSRRGFFDKIVKKIYADMIDIGPAFVHVGWDPNAGNVMMSDVESMLGNMSAKITEEEKEVIRKNISRDGTLRSGDVNLEFVKMFELIVFDPYEQDIQEQPWIMRIKTYDKDVAEKLFGTTFSDSETVGRITNTPDRTSFNRTIVDNLGIYNPEEIDNQIVIKEYFEKPNAIYPKGRRIVFCREKILSSGDMPYINGEYEQRIYPFIKFGLDTPNLFYSHAFIEDLKSIQKRYNQVRNRKFEHITKSVHGQLLIQEGSTEDDEKITNKPGGIIWYKRGYNPPTTINTSNTGSVDAESELRSLENEFIKVSGMSTLSTSGSPNSSAVRGANMVQMLMESDDSKVSLIIDTLSTGVTELSKHIIRLYKQFMLPGEVRFTRFTKNLSTVVNWKSDLLVEHIDIKNRSKLTMTDSRRQENMQMLLNMGLLSAETGIAPELRIRIIEELDLGIPITEMPFEGIADVNKARRENSRIVNNFAEIDADQYDNHDLHYAVHSDYIKGEEYLSIVTANPEIDQVMRAHIDQHYQIVDAKRRQAMADAAAAEKNKKGGK